MACYISNPLVAEVFGDVAAAACLGGSLVSLKQHRLSHVTALLLH